MVVAALARTFNAVDYGVRADGLVDDAGALAGAVNAAIAQGGGRVVLPVASVVLIASSIALAAGVELVIPISSVLRLRAGSNVDMLTIAAAGVKITGGGTIDGNRANQTAGTAHGINCAGATDVLIDDVTVTGARTNGINVAGSSRVELRGVTVTDCGTHGIALASSSRCVVANSASYDNSRLAAIGAGDGVNLSGTSSDNAVLGLVAYDSAGAGGRQGYAAREAAGMTGDRNVFASVAGVANALGILSTVGANSGLQSGSPTGAVGGTDLGGAYPAPTMNERTWRAVAAADAFAATDGTIGADAAGGAFNVTLPTAVGIGGRRYTLVRRNAGPNAVGLATTGGQTISAAAAPFMLTALGQAVTVQSDGANWWIV